MVRSTLFYSLLMGSFVFVYHVRETVSENFEFHLSNAMLIQSLRIFEQINDIYVFKSTNGSIILKADAGYGIMGVVQEMNLQGIQEPSGCLDFIQMSQIEGTGATKEICGSLESYPGNLHPTFLDKSGFLELDYVLTEKTRLSPLDSNITNFNVSFTTFTECPEDAFPFGDKDLRPCSLLDTFSCISTAFFCDGVINCAFPHEFGLDEQNCLDFDSIEETVVQIEVMSDDIETAPKLPYDINQDVSADDQVVDVDNPQLQSRISFILWKFTNKATGLLASFTIFVLLMGLIKSKSGGGIDNVPRRSERLLRLAVEVEVQGMGVGDSGSSTEKSSGAFLMSEGSNYDTESDPVPSYEDCLLDYSTRPVYCALSIEHERPPPYEEVRVHRSSTKSKSARGLNY